MESLDINCSHLEDTIVVKGPTLRFPARYLELYFSDFLEDANIEYTLITDSGASFVQISISNGCLVDRNGAVTKIDRDQLYLVQISAFHAQHWYPELPPGSTFPSVLIPLSPKEVSALIQLKIRWDQLDVSKDGFYTSDVTECAPAGTERIKQSDQELFTLVGTLNTLIRKIQTHNTLTGTIFVRLNSVSPKSNTNRIVCDPRCNPKWVTQILNLLVDSLRTYETLSIPMDHYIMLRQWQKIDPAMEFRCFVYKNRLTAISQYHCYQHFKKLQGRAKEIRDRIYEFYQKVFPYLIYEDCVMDVILTDTDVQIVEFNSFGADGMAGSSLYHWTQDRAIIYAEHEDSTDIRLVTEKKRFQYEN